MDFARGVVISALQAARQERPHRHQNHLQARPADFPRHASSATTCCTSACRSWLSSTRRSHPDLRRTNRPDRTNSSTPTASSSSSSTSIAPRRRSTPKSITHRGSHRRAPKCDVALQYNDGYSENVRSLRQQHRQPRRGHAPQRLPQRPHPLAQQLRQKRRPLQGLRPHRGRLPRRADRRHLRSRARSAVRRADQDQARQQRGRRHRHLGRQRRPEQVLRRESRAAAKLIAAERPAGGRGPRGGRKGPRNGPPQRALTSAAACPEKLRDCRSRDLAKMRALPGRR